MNGRDGWVGLIGVVRQFMADTHFDSRTESIVETYLNFISKRASGELVGPATWIRKFINDHPKYQHDSVVNPEVNNDLLNAIQQICTGVRKVTIYFFLFSPAFSTVQEPSLLGDFDVTANEYEDGVVKFGAGGCCPERK